MQNGRIDLDLVFFYRDAFILFIFSASLRHEVVKLEFIDSFIHSFLLFCTDNWN